MVNVTEGISTLNHRTTKDGKLEAEVSIQPPHFNNSWIIELAFTVPDNESARVTTVTLFHAPSRRDTLHVKCVDIQEKDETKTITRVLKRWNNSLHIPFRDIKIQVSCFFFLLSRLPTDTR